VLIGKPAAALQTPRLSTTFVEEEFVLRKFYEPGLWKRKSLERNFGSEGN
jgi:hypothetical protein